MDLSLGRYLAHPADPRTPEVPEYAVEQAADRALSTSGHWASFIADFATDDLSEVKTYRIKAEDLGDHDAATLLVMALTGTNEQANTARMLLQDLFVEHHAELIEQLANEPDDESDDWEAA